MRLKYWQRWGLVAAVCHLVAAAALGQFQRIWWFQETYWYRALMAIDYPVGVLHGAVLRLLNVPRLYDVAPPAREVLITHCTGIPIGFAWWFVIGAVASLSVRALRMKLRRKPA